MWRNPVPGSGPNCSNAGKYGAAQVTPLNTFIYNILHITYICVRAYIERRFDSSWCHVLCLFFLSCDATMSVGQMWSPKHRLAISFSF